MTESKRNKNRITLSTHLSKEPAADPWVSQAEAARIRGISRQAIAKLIKKQRFRVLRVGGRLFLRRRDVEHYRAERPGRPKNERKNTRAKKSR